MFFAQATQPVVQVLGFWGSIAHDLLVNFVLTIAVPVVGTFLVTFLRAQSKKATAEADKADVEKGKIVVDRAKAYTLDAAASIAEQRFPGLAKKIMTGQIKTQDQIKTELASWGNDLRDKTITYFKDQGVDLKGQIGEQGVEDIVAIAANKASPFPGQQTSQVLSTKENAQKLLEKGVTYAKQSVGEFKVDYNNISLDT